MWMSGGKRARDGERQYNVEGREGDGVLLSTAMQGWGEWG